LAGVPGDVIRRAKDVLRQLTEAQAKPQRTAPEVNSNITFDDFKADEVREKLINTDVNLLTPVEALNLLVELKKLAD
jgi:DNA mismatch repair protein MutS